MVRISRVPCLKITEICPNYKDSVAGCLPKTYKFLFIAQRKQLLFRALLNDRKVLFQDHSSYTLLKSLIKRAQDRLREPFLRHTARYADVAIERNHWGRNEHNGFVIFRRCSCCKNATKQLWRFHCLDFFLKKWIKLWESLSDQIREHILKTLFLIHIQVKSFVARLF